MSATEANYTAIAPEIAFARTSANPIDKRLDFCAYFLALIQTLDARQESYDDIRKICLEIVTEYVRPKNLVQRMVKRIPAMLIGSWPARMLLRKLDRRVSRPNEGGFVARIITNRDATYGWVIVWIFLNAEFVNYSLGIIIPGIRRYYVKSMRSPPNWPGLKLIRSGTIARGAIKCDFRFQRRK